MSIDYKEIKKGIKRADMDGLRFKGNIVFSIMGGCIIGFITSNAVIGFVSFFVFGIIAACKYYEVGKK
jgi:hypothetical protein